MVLECFCGVHKYIEPMRVNCRDPERYKSVGGGGGGRERPAKEGISQRRSKTK